MLDSGEALGGGPVPDRRSLPDRRRTDPLLADWRVLLRGRRRRGRRATDDAAPDRLDGRVLAMAVAILGMSALDATLTLGLIATGHVYEANPFLRWVLEHDVQIFVNLKTAVTSAGVLLLVAASRSRLARRLPARRVLRGVLAAYACLIAWELMLIVRVSRGF
jgi:hypothetical protein